MERITKPELARTGLVVLVLAELLSAGLGLFFRFVPDLLASASGLWGNEWFWRLYGVASSGASLVAVTGLALFAAALKDQALGWSAVLLGAFDALIGVALSFATIGPDERWVFAVTSGLFFVGSSLMVFAIALAAKDAVPALLAIAAAASIVFLASAGWSVERLLTDARTATDSQQVKALRLVLRLLVDAGLIAVPLVAWLGLGRAAPPAGARGA